MHTLYKKLLLWFMSSSVYEFLLLHVIPFIRFTTYYTSFRGNQYQAGYKLLRPGDIILAKDKKKLTGLLIPGDFSHAAFCVSKGEEFEIVEMTHHNYTKSWFFDVCKESDRIVIIRCVDWDSDYIKKVIAKALSFDGAHYDTEFELGIKALYCSELIYQADVDGKLRVDLSDLADLGRPYISPTGLYRAENVSVVFDSQSIKPTY